VNVIGIVFIALCLAVLALALWQDPSRVYVDGYHVMQARNFYSFHGLFALRMGDTRYLFMNGGVQVLHHAVGTVFNGQRFGV